MRRLGLFFIINQIRCNVIIHKIDKGSSNTNAEERARKVEESYQNARNAKPGSITAKANMVRDFDERKQEEVIVVGNGRVS